MPVIFLTTPGPGTWTVPNDCSVAKIQCIGAGAGGLTTTATIFGGGGGAGAYAAVNAISLTPGATVFLSIGTAGAANTGGGDTWINKAANSAPAVATNGALAKGGAAATTNGTVGGLGGAAASCVGDVTFSGGSGGNSTSPSATGGGGGGGSAGPSGAGAAGGLCPGALSSAGGGGGGGSNGGASTAGGASTSGATASGAGGAGTGGTGGGTANGGAGTAGGGGGGGNGSASTGTAGGAGGADTAFDGSHGCGGGGGGGGGGGNGGGNGGAASGYGGGGGGGGFGNAPLGVGGAGGAGIIAITYISTNIGYFPPFESASRPLTSVAAKDFPGFVYTPPPTPTPRPESFFSPWETAKAVPRTIADFSGFLFTPPPNPAPKGQGFFSQWDAPNARPGRADSFQGFVAYLSAPYSVFDLWTPPPRGVTQPLDTTSWVFFQQKAQTLPDIDAVRRPERFRQKAKPKFRHDYSIYNHPDFDRLHVAADEEEPLEESPIEEDPVAVIIAIGAPDAPVAPPPPVEPHGQLLPIEHLPLFDKSWGHAIAPTPEAPAPEQTKEPDPDADDVFAAVTQSALQKIGQSPHGQTLNYLILGAMEQGDVDREEKQDMLRELKSILFGNI
jgi:hypothetical protein